MSIFKQIAFILSALVLASIAGYLAFAWTEPTEAPPDGNVPAPINVGSVAQTKEGVLQINADFTANRLLDSSNNSYYVDPANAGFSALFAGNVGIGTTDPGSRKLKVVGDLEATTLYGDGSNLTGIWDANPVGSGSVWGYTSDCVWVQGGEWKWPSSELPGCVLAGTCKLGSERLTCTSSGYLASRPHCENYVYITCGGIRWYHYKYQGGTCSTWEYKCWLLE